MNPFMKMHLHMLRAACLTVVTAIDLTLEADAVLADAPAPEKNPLENNPPAGGAESDEGKVFDANPFKCQHPKSHWVSAPAMGHPARILCKCGETMED